MTTTRRRAPIMFQRRLMLLMACGIVACLLMMGQLVRLAIVEGGIHRTEAESRLQFHEWIPTWRGTIFDRHGRPLARDEPGYEIAVSWRAITGTWAEYMAIHEARDSVDQGMWNSFSPEEREARIAVVLPEWKAVEQQLWAYIAEASGDAIEDIDQTLDSQRARVQHMAAVVWDRQQQRHEARYGVSDAFKVRPIAEQQGFHVVVPHVTDEGALPLQAFSERWPSLVQVRYARHRSYPNETIDVTIDQGHMPRPLRSKRDRIAHVERVADQLLGRVRYDVWAEDMARRPFQDGRTGVIDRGGYRQVDRVGARGIEQGWEDQLRGERGVVVTSRRTGDVLREPPVPGHDVVLSIDAELQARVEAILDVAGGLTRVQPWHGNQQLPIGEPLAAAAVVLDIPTGEILAIASTPTLLDADSMSEVEQQERSPWVNRAVAATYPPGSIVKPLVLAAALMENTVKPDSMIECQGHYFSERDDVARCWIYRPRFGMATHGSLAASEALGRSCNCYFYELGARLGLERLADWLSWFGMGQSIPTGLGGPNDVIWESASGSLPDQSQRDSLHAQGEARFESVMMSIGQGRLTWTPLHAANAYATLVRGGKRLPPTLVRGHRGVLDEDVVDDERELTPEVVRTVLDGLKFGVTKSWGTGSRIKYGEGDYEPIFTVPGVSVMGKTGTAQSPPWVRDVNGNGHIAPGERTTGLEHAWFVGLVGDDSAALPRYAIAVLIEYGGSGGRVAGPVANQIVEALRDEGYVGGNR
ncbi:MAG: penicillin-binding transpeptidase domain-containing protein [Planctomycetota bacterium]|nr:penicillin-binding transpeptidase domain-containing protein [Planctomycetota bacterium]